LGGLDLQLEGTLFNHLVMTTIVVVLNWPYPKLNV